jgi:hypothetical protein
MAAALDIITDAMQEIGAIGAGETPNSNDAALGLSRLNLMMSSWSIQPMTIPVIRREVFDIVSNQSTYTIGPGADLDTTRPTMLTGAGLLLNNTSPVVEIPRGLLTDDGYRSIQVKTLTSPLFTNVYYNPTFSTDGWGTIFLWPTPTNAINQLVLYRPEQLSEFTDLATQYVLPPGCQEAMLYNLAMRMCKPFGRPVDDALSKMARTSLATFKRANTKMADLINDAAMLGSGAQQYGYNIQTSNM